MSKETEEKIKNWETEYLLDEVLYSHMEEANPVYWQDIVDEGLRLYNLMNLQKGEKAEAGSPIDCLLAVVALQAAKGVVTGISRMFDLDDLDKLGMVIMPYTEEDHEDPITYEEFIKAYNEASEIYTEGLQ